MGEEALPDPTFCIWMSDTILCSHIENVMMPTGPIPFLNLENTLISLNEIRELLKTVDTGIKVWLYLLQIASKCSEMRPSSLVY